MGLHQTIGFHAIHQQYIQTNIYWMSSACERLVTKVQRKIGCLSPQGGHYSYFQAPEVTESAWVLQHCVEKVLGSQVDFNT